MLKPPFEIIRCSWPRPIEHIDHQWISEPEWDAPLMPLLPQPCWADVNGNICWTIDWRTLFGGTLKYCDQSHMGGEMRGFHVIFQIQINGNGKLLFWNDGCIIRRDKEIIYSEPTAQPITRGEISARTGDCLEIAQRQNSGDWLWAAWLMPENESSNLSSDLLLPYLSRVQQRLQKSDGPPLKVFFSGRSPLRSILAVYSMILNGYSPADIFVFGEYQWTDQSRRLFAELLPFAHIVATEEILQRLRSLGTPRLAQLAQRYWYVMKTCVSLLYPPEEYCFMDDDVFILDSVEDALAAFQRHNLVFAADADYSKDYLALWDTALYGHVQLRTGRLNAGLYWLRNLHDPQQLATAMLRVSPRYTLTLHWEQGFLAIQYAHETLCQLPTQRYFFPYFDGLPGGVLGYDYADNPCGFTSIHFGGLVEKPSDMAALLLAPDILSRHTNLNQ